MKAFAASAGESLFLLASAAALKTACGCQGLYSRPRGARGGSANRRFVAKTADRAERARFSREGAPPRVPSCRAGQAFWRGFWRPGPGRLRLAGRRGGRGIFARIGVSREKRATNPVQQALHFKNKNVEEKEEGVSEPLLAGKSALSTSPLQKRLELA